MCHSLLSPLNTKYDGTMAEHTSSDGDMNVFRPPLVRSTAALDRALFSKTFNLAAARVNDPKNIAKYRKALTSSRDILHAERLTPIVQDPGASAAEKGRKCLLLQPRVSASGF